MSWETITPSPTFRVFLGCSLDLRNWIYIFINFIIQETDSFSGYFLRKSQFYFSVYNEKRKIYAAQVAGFKRQEWLFSAGVCGRDIAKRRREVIPVYAVIEKNAWFAIPPDPLDNLGKYTPKQSILFACSRPHHPYQLQQVP